MTTNLSPLRSTLGLAILVLGNLAAAHEAHAQTTLTLFTRPGCPRCAEAKEFLSRWQMERSDLVVEERDVSTDGKALEALRKLSERAGIHTPGVPAFAMGEAILIGFDTETTPSLLRRWLAGGEVTTGNGEICTAETQACETVEAPGDRDAVALPLLGTLRVDALGLPLFTILIGLADGFNPCATWVLLFLLAMLVNLKDRSRMALVAGTFVVVSGLVYFAFMAAWLTFFTVIGISQPVRIALALLALVIGVINIKDFFAFGRGPSLSIPEAAKPGIYTRARDIVKANNLIGALAGIVVLALLVNLVELLCTAGLPALYTAILTSRGLPPGEYYAYLALYIAAYMLDDAILVTIGVVTLGRKKLQERGGRWLKLLSGTMILVLGVLLLVRPAWMGF